MLHKLSFYSGRNQVSKSGISCWESATKVGTSNCANWCSDFGANEFSKSSKQTGIRARLSKCINGNKVRAIPKS